VILDLPGVLRRRGDKDTPKSAGVWIGPMTAAPDQFRDDASS